MQHSRDRIVTSHAGSLPRPDALIAANQARQSGGDVDEARFQTQLQSAVVDVVRRQKELGIDIPGDGEYGKAMGHRVNYGAWWSYSFQRLGGLDLTGPGLYEIPARRAQPGEVVLTSFADRRDRQRFAAAYADPESGITTGPRARTWPICTGPLTYTGHDAIARDIANFKAGLDACGIAEGFMTSVAPGSASRISNAYYKTEEEFMFACAEAMREEYKAIVDAGLILQLDDPSIAENWDQINPEPTVEAYRKFTMLRVEALNAAIKGLPRDRIRFHLCWGSWHGPHTTDIPMKDIVDVMLAINCGAYSFEAGNVRHEHEWRVWQDVKLPDDKLILPGVVSHATNVVEHPELVAERIVRFANLVGRERVIAATDCGLGGRVHADIAWAKLEALAQGAAWPANSLAVKAPVIARAKREAIPGDCRRCTPRNELRLLDDLHLRAVRAFHEGDVTAVVGRQLLQDAHAVLAQRRQRAGIVIGIHRHVLDAVVLFVVLHGDQRGDVELQTVQIDLHAAAGDVGLQLCAEIVDIELRGLVRIGGLQVHVLDGKGHGRSSLVDSGLRGRKYCSVNALTARN